MYLGNVDMYHVSWWSIIVKFATLQNHHDHYQNKDKGVYKYMYFINLDLFKFKFEKNLLNSD